MLSNYETNFYIRRDNDDLLWAGISINVPEATYISYKLSCFIKKDKKGTWNAEQTELIIFDISSNMYIISKYDLSQIYKKNAKNRDVQLLADFSKLADDYHKVEVIQIPLNELLLKDVIDEFKLKIEHSFGVKIKI